MSRLFARPSWKRTVAISSFAPGLLDLLGQRQQLFEGASQRDLEAADLQLDTPFEGDVLALQAGPGRLGRGEPGAGRDVAEGHRRS